MNVTRLTAAECRALTSTSAADAVHTALSRKPAARWGCGRMMGQTDGQTRHFTGCAPYRPNVREVSIIEEKPVDTISTLFVLHTSS